MLTRARQGYEMDQMQQDEVERPTVFLHSSWRTSSTWLWSCFRRSESTVAYVEIFHETLASLESSQIAKLTPGSWPSGHPAGAPYLLEFLPLLTPQGGVARYRASMAIESFVPAAGLAGDLSREEVEYVDMLIGHARRLDRQPVLADTRTLGRLGALKRQFGGIHILLHRNLLHQWASYSRLAYEGNTFFLLMIKNIIEFGQHDPFLRDLRQLYPLGPPDCRSENYFMAFLLLHLYLYTHAFAHASMAIDVTRLARNADYRRKIQRRIRKQTTIELDLDTVRENFEFSLLPYPDLAELRENLVASMQSIRSFQNAGKSEVRRAHLLIEGLIEEMERHNFYASGVTSILCRPGGLLDVRSERDRLVGEQEALRNQQESLVRERSELVAEQDAFRKERDALAPQV